MMVVLQFKKHSVKWSSIVSSLCYWIHCVLSSLGNLFSLNNPSLTRSFARFFVDWAFTQILKSEDQDQESIQSLLLSNNEYQAKLNHELDLSIVNNALQVTGSYQRSVVHVGPGSKPQLNGNAIPVQEQKSGKSTLKSKIRCYH
ncbi:hypothetical protein L1987_11466 [Smallanthus sonchifolius]|uniref:Uncharacterized protein n=1 Tax=Smallanthus sonchifolius TaxID=185202 RepID=A0ACB9JDP6_9ASTR|nr:hypothetical protein L1987_11466 [Smallanthus sonchifolius]